MRSQSKETKLIVAYMLINCILGHEEKILKNITTISKDIKTARGTYGVHDLIVVLKTRHADKLTELCQKIRKVEDVTSTVTLTVIPEQGGKG